MRILHLCAIPQLTGAAEPMLDLVRAERALGATVDLHVDTKRSGNLRKLLHDAGEPVPRVLTLSTKAGAVAAVRDAARIFQMASQYDVVHVHLSHDHALAAAALFGRSRPILVRTVHARRVLKPGFGRRWSMRRARGVTVACTAHKKLLEEAHGVDESRILVSPGSVDASRFRPDPSARSRVRAELKLSPNDFVIGCVARFQAGRRHEVIIDAFLAAKKLEPSLKLVLIGHGETEGALLARAHGEVLFPGYKRGDLNDYLAALDAAVWLVPGNDATSRAVLQAMAAGLPVVGGAEEAIADAVLSEVTGVLVDPDRTDRVTEAFLSLARAPERARKMGEAARARAVEVYDPIARGRRVLSFYEELIGAHETRALHRGA